MAMTKKEFIAEIKDLLARDQNVIISKQLCEAAANIVFEIICLRVSIDGEFSYPGFGKFKKVTRAARTAKNPRTGEPVEVPEKDVVIFKVAPSFLDA